MRFLSLCSGIEAASVAWLPLGWQAVAYSEIEPFACAVLSARHQGVPNLGDMTKINGEEYRGTVDLIVGGTPCQSFSVAGKRGGMADPRGQLALAFIDLVRAMSPRWVVWENVPGALSSNGGLDFAAFTKALAECGYWWAYRVLDAQYFGVPQRRRRVFLVGHLGDWRPAAAVLFESHCLRGDSAPRRKTRADITQALTGRLGGGGPDDNKAQGGFYVPDIVSQAMSCKWSKGTSGPSGDEHHNLIAFHGSQDPDVSGAISHPVARNQGRECCVAFAERGRAAGRTLEYQEEQAYCLTNLASGGCAYSRRIMTPQMRVRRLTPRECERLQGFPDDYTAIRYRGKPAADAPRYRALGNSMAVPVMRWIGERIERVMLGRATA